MKTAKSIVAHIPVDVHNSLKGLAVKMSIEQGKTITLSYLVRAALKAKYPESFPQEENING